MARMSEAKKKRLKKEREGLRNPEWNRLTNNDFADISLHVRVPKNKKAYDRNKSKNHLKSSKDDRDGFIFLTFFLFSTF